MCLHVNLNLLFCSPYVEPPMMNCGHQQKCRILLCSPGSQLIFLWVKIAPPAEDTIVLVCIGVFVAKMMDYTGNSRKGPLGNNDPFIRKWWLQMLDWLVCVWWMSLFLDWSIHFIPLCLHVCLYPVTATKWSISKLLHVSESCLLWHRAARYNNKTLFARDQFYLEQPVNWNKLSDSLCS